MKIESVKDKLEWAVRIAEKLTSKAASLPVLKCILFSVDEGSLKIKATNLDLGIEISIPVKILKEGTVAVPGSTISNFISNLGSDKSVSLETKEGNLHISSKNSSALLKAYSSEEFPSLPPVSEEHSFSINAKEFVKGLRSVWWSASISSMKPEISSVCIYPEGEDIVFVATDSFRLAEKKVRCKEKPDFDKVLIPFKNAAEIIRILEEAPKDVKISFDKNQISFSFDNVYLVSRLIEGNFPAYQQIIPKESKTEAVIIKQDLVSSLRTANIFSDTFNRILIKVTPDEKKFELLTKNNDVGENDNTLDAALTGEPIEISFNYKNIADCFQSIDADSVSLSFNGANRPLVIKSVGDTSFFYLVMPMNK
jgi:DNA polymerase-3 subunit beta